MMHLLRRLRMTFLIAALIGWAALAAGMGRASAQEPIEVAVSLSRDSKSNPGRVIWIVLDVSEPEADER